MKDFLKESVRFVMKTEVLVGDGIARKLRDYLKKWSWSKVGLVFDKGLYEANSYAREIIGLLKEGLDNVVSFVNEMPEPTYDYLDEAKKMFKGHNLDCFVGIGGGSTLDLAKGLATLKTNEGRAIDYRGFGKVHIPPLPVVALPTTAGSGSEVTPYAVFIDAIEKWKFGINTEFNYPKLAMYDPGFLDSCPAIVIASSGMDAMTHALESFAAKDATILSKMYSMKAFKLLFENLKKIARGDRSTETKLGLMLGSGCAGIALMNSGAGPSGALSYPLGVYFNVPHGLAGSVFLPEVIKYNVNSGYTEYSELYDIVFEDHHKNPAAKAIQFSTEIKNLSDELGIPVTLKGFGVKTEKDLRMIIDNSMQLKAAFEQNPATFGKEQIENIIFSLA